MIVDKVHCLKHEALKEGLCPEYVIMNKEHLQFLKQELEHEYKPEYDWTEAIGGTMLDMLIVYNPDITEIAVGRFDNYKSK